MTLLNLCAGAVRIVDDIWINLDSLHDVLAPGTPERSNLDAEPNYVNWNIPQDGKLPFADEMFDGVLASHCFEHWDCQQGVAVMRECRRVLKRHGTLLVSVPDASVFRVYEKEDTVENAVRLFGEPIHLPDGETTFANYCLWNRFHKVILTEDALWAYFLRAGFKCIEKHRKEGGIMIGRPLEFRTMKALLNRIPFSLVMSAEKT